MAIQPEKLIGDPVFQVRALRVFPDHDGIRSGQLAQFGADTVLPHLTPLSYDEGNSVWNVWDDGTLAIDDIDGFLYAPQGHTALLAGETLIDIFRKGSIDARDIPLPTTASQTQNALDTALSVDPGLRQKNIEVLGLDGVH